MSDIQKYKPPMQISIMAKRLSIEPQEMHNIVINSVMPAKTQITDAQFTTFLSVANEYQLNPLTKEIYAFPTKGGGIQPIVSVDGWLKIINQNPCFDGMEFLDHIDDDGLTSVTCKIYRNDRKHPVEVTEYMEECAGPPKDKYGNKTPWGRWPARMLRHKATIQAARYAFGLSGIIDPDEAQRYEEQGVINITEKDVTPTVEFPKLELEKILTDKDPSQYLPWLTKALNREIKSLDDLSEEEAQATVIKLENSKQ